MREPSEFVSQLSGVPLLAVSHPRAAALRLLLAGYTRPRYRITQPVRGRPHAERAAMKAWLFMQYHHSKRALGGSVA